MDPRDRLVVCSHSARSAAVRPERPPRRIAAGNDSANAASTGSGYSGGLVAVSRWEENLSGSARDGAKGTAVTAATSISRMFRLPLKVPLGVARSTTPQCASSACRDSRSFCLWIPAAAPHPGSRSWRRAAAPSPPGAADRAPERRFRGWCPARRRLYLDVPADDCPVRPGPVALAAMLDTRGLGRRAARYSLVLGSRGGAWLRLCAASRSPRGAT